jgi:hypothetical protein
MAKIPHFAEIGRTEGYKMGDNVAGDTGMNQAVSHGITPMQ